MVYCTYCGQSFTRDEHLERHILTHTNIKPFKCFTCHMSFARRDLLQRHYLVHGKDQDKAAIPAANGMIPKSAGRTPIACSNCAKTKTKCDKKFPCSRCSARNLTCTVRPVRRATKGGPRLSESGEMSIAPGTSLEPGAQAQPQAISPAPAQRPPLKPASPKNVQPAPEIRPAVQFAESPSVSMSGTVASTPVSGPQSNFMLGTPLSYDDFSRPDTGSSETISSPNFMLDWNALQVPLGVGYESMMQPHMLLHPSPEALHFDHQPLLPIGPPPSANGMLAIMPDLTNGVLTPDETPKLERTLEDVDGSSVNGRHVSRHSVDSQGELVGEMPAIVQARAAWSTFRCTPTIPSSACPKTARLHLERLEQTLKDHEGWSSWTPTLYDTEGAGGDYLTVMQLHESTRDKLLAIMQSFLHKALEIHREGVNHHHSATGLPTPNGASNFVLLPPGRVLEYFLRSYANSFERYYPLTSKGILDANELMHCYNDRAASLLVLMMIAQGAMVEARMLTGGLTETARISLFDLIEKNIIMASDPIVLHAALLFTVQAAWSGDKWQMDIAKGQRNMYFSMLRHSGALENRPSPPVVRDHVNTDALWCEWINGEHRNRLVYSSVMIDQELALFNDMAPLISVTECVTPMPDADRLWQAKSAAEWSQLFEQVHEFSSGFSSVGSGVRPPSLRDVFRSFVDGELEGRGDQPTPLQLRLLLSPLQSQVTQLSQLLTCFSDSTARRPSSSGSSNNTSRGPTKDTTRTRLGEIQALLGSWFALTERYLNHHPMCAMMQINLIIYHLISLNAVTDFPEIERLARGENRDGLFTRHRCIVDTEEAVYHCGQVLRMVRLMPRGIRPPWWTAAIYRAALILWTNALTQASASSPLQMHFPVATGPSFAIDNLAPDHPLVIKYLTKREGVPCVTKHDGGLMGVEQPFALLQHCVEVIDEGAATRFSDGIRAKIERLAQC